MKIFSILFLSIFSFSSFAECRLATFETIIKINNIQDSSLISKTNCDSNIQKNFTNFITNAQGSVHAKHVEKYLLNEFNQRVLVTPKKFVIKYIGDLISTHYNLGSDYIVTNVTSLMGKSGLYLNSNDEISFQCQNCDSSGSKNVQLKINKKKNWLTADFQKKKYVYFAQKDISPSTVKLENDFFQQKVVIDKGQAFYFNDIKNLKYYKVTQTLRKGDLLKSHHLRPKNLVHYGEKVNVLFQGKKISLSSKAVARANGRIGDYIKLYNEKSKKIIRGKVTDFNTVVIEL